MLPDRVSNPGPLTYESGALPIALRGPATPTNADTEAHFGLQCQGYSFSSPLLSQMNIRSLTKISLLSLPTMTSWAQLFKTNNVVS